MVYANFPLRLPNGATLLPDGSAFCVVEIDTDAPALPPIRWNPYNKVVQDHRDGTIHDAETNVERAKRGLPVPWTSEMVIGRRLGGQRHEEERNEDAEAEARREAIHNR